MRAGLLDESLHAPLSEPISCPIFRMEAVIEKNTALYKTVDLRCRHYPLGFIEQYKRNHRIYRIWKIRSTRLDRCPGDCSCLTHPFILLVYIPHAIYYLFPCISCLRCQAVKGERVKKDKEWMSDRKEEKMKTVSWLWSNHFAAIRLSDLLPSNETIVWGQTFFSRSPVNSRRLVSPTLRPRTWKWCQ